MQMGVETVQSVLAAHLLTSPKPQVSKYYIKNKISSSHSRNDKDGANHDSRIQPRSPLSRQTMNFDASPTYHAEAFYEIQHDKLHPILQVSEHTNVDITRTRNAHFGAEVLREQAHKHVGDTGLLDHLRVPEGSVDQLRRRHSADGAMEYWLEPADLAEVRRQAGVSDPYWVPPPGWKPGDGVSLVTGDFPVKRQVEELTEEVNAVQRQMEQLMCKDDGDFDAERAYNSLKEKHQRAVRADEKLQKQMFCFKKPQVSKYYFENGTSTSHSRNAKDDGNHDSRIQPRSPLSRHSLTVDATPTYQTGAFYQISHDKLPPKSPIYVKPIRVVKVSECADLGIMRSRDASFGTPMMMQVLQNGARKHIGDTGLPDELLKHMIGWAPEGSVDQIGRPHNADGAMEYWLKSAELDEIWRQAGVWKRQVEELTEEINGLKRQLVQLMCKDDVDFDGLKDMCENVSLLHGELKEISAFKEHIADKSDKLEEHITYLSTSFLRFKDQLVLSLKMVIERELAQSSKAAAPGGMVAGTDGTVIQGSRDRPVRKSSFRVCKPWEGRRMFSTSRPEISDLQPLFDVIGPLHNRVHWPLNDPVIQPRYNEVIGHCRLYHYVYGQSLDVSSLLGSQKIIFTTAMSGTQYIDVSYAEDGKLYAFTLVLDAREGWNYDWKNEHGTFEYKNSILNPYIIDEAVIHLDFLSDYSRDGLCPLGHGSTLLGREAVRVACKIMSQYDGTAPAPPQVQVACSIIVNYLVEAVKLHDVQYFNNLSLADSSTVCTLDDCEPALSLLMKRWARISEPHMHFLISQLHSPSIAMQQVPGIQNLYPLVDAVAVRPFNRIPHIGPNERTWNSYSQDVTDGSPHNLSMDFLERWPYHPQVAKLHPRVMDLKSIGRLVRRPNLASEGITNLIGVVNSTANHNQRFCLSRSAQGMKVLNWLKRCL